MKKIILALALTISAAAFAETASTIFPRVYNYGTNVQIQVWNHTDRYVTCSGPVWMTTDSGLNISEYYFDSVMPRTTAFRTLHARNFQDPIRFVNHSIFCR
jgi:hypothetical protein